MYLMKYTLQECYNLVTGRPPIHQHCNLKVQNMAMQNIFQVQFKGEQKNYNSETVFQDLSHACSTNPSITVESEKRKRPEHFHQAEPLAFLGYERNVGSEGLSLKELCIREITGTNNLVTRLVIFKIFSNQKTVSSMHKLVPLLLPDEKDSNSEQELCIT